MADGSFKIDDSEWQEIQKALRKFAPETKKVMNRTIRQAANRVKADAARGFKEYSGNVHKALGVQVTSKHVAIQLRKRKVAYAPISETGGRHPVYGNRRVWVDHPARPRLGPAVDAVKPRLAREIDEAVTDAARQSGVIKRR